MSKKTISLANKVAAASNKLNTLVGQLQAAQAAESGVAPVKGAAVKKAAPAAKKAPKGVAAKKVPAKKAAKVAPAKKTAKAAPAKKTAKAAKAAPGRKSVKVDDSDFSDI